MLPLRVAPAVLTALLLCLAGCGGGKADDKGGGQGQGGPGQGGPQRTPEVGVVTLKVGSAPYTVELAGRTTAFETAEVRPQVSGVIQQRLFTEGSVVRKGQTLYQIDPSLYQAAVAQARANLRSAQANQKAANLLAQRYAPLAKIEAVSQQEADNARAQAQQADAAVAQQQAALRTAEINLRFTRVPAPISGRIGRSNVTTGALATTNQADPLVTIQRLDPIFADFQQSADEVLALRRAVQAGDLKRGDLRVRIAMSDGQPYEQTGQLLFADPQVNPTTGSVTLRAIVPNPRGLLLPGMYVRANILEVVQQNIILAPQQGISRDPRGQATALVVGPGDRVEQRRVVADRTVGNQWVITDGLKAGDRLIVEGTASVKPGQTVRVVPAGTRQQRSAPAGAAGPGGSGQGVGETRPGQPQDGRAASQ